jgi:hypothetical protein
MKFVGSSINRRGPVLALAWVIASAIQLAPCNASAAEGTVMYRCPGNEYSNTLSAKEAKDKGCKSIESAPITIIQGPRPNPQTARPAGASGASPAGSRVDPADQRARDTDARRILESELKREEDSLAALKAEFNNGAPERQGNERNYQKYIDRVAELKATIARKESDISALRREIAKQPQ